MTTALFFDLPVSAGGSEVYYHLNFVVVVLRQILGFVARKISPRVSARLLIIKPLQCGAVFTFEF